MFLKISLLLLCLIRHSQGQGHKIESPPPEEKEKVYWYVYTGRHFDDLVTNSSEGGYSKQVVKPTLLVLYEDFCEDRAEALLKKAKRDFPYEHYITVLKHNYGDEAIKEIHYELDKKDNLFDRYVKDDRCMHVLYFEEGNTVEEYTDIPLPIDVSGFVWHRLFRPISIHNDYSKDIIIKTSYDPENIIYENVISPGTSSIMYPYVSNFINIYDTQGNFLYGKIHTTDSSGSQCKLEINEKLVDKFKQRYKNFIERGTHVNFKLWANDRVSAEQQKQAKVRKFRGEMGRLYMICLHYPKTLPRITKTGYQVTQIKSELFSTLQDYCQSTFKQLEGLTKVMESKEPVTNTDAAATFKYNLTKDIEKELQEFVEPIAQELVGSKVKMLHIGLFSYSENSFIRDHINIKSDYVITALLVIGEVQSDANNDEAMNWPAELIDFEGKRKTIDIKPGEMIIYEAKTIIIARRSPLKSAKNYFVASITFKPAQGWPIQFMDTNSERYQAYLAQHEKPDEQSFKAKKTGFGSKEEL